MTAAADGRPCIEMGSRRTHEEAAVAAHLLKGLSPQAVADRMEVSISTVRSHIRSTFLKAGVNSQIEMLAAIRCRI